MILSQDLVKQHRVDNTKIFKKYAPIYDLVEFVVGNIRKKIADELPPHATILDVACGTGTQAVYLAQRGHDVVGVDISPHMLARARAKGAALPNLTFLARDATATQLPAHSFDASMISFGLHDMPESIAIATLTEIQRVTKPGGQIYILDYGRPANAFLRSSSKLVCSIWESDHYRAFVDKGIKYYLRASGLEVASRRTYLSGVIEFIVACPTATSA